MIAQEAPDSIRSICENLRASKAALTSEAISTLLMQLAKHPQDLRAFERFEDSSYSRNRIYANDFVDLLLLCWKTKQRTPIHNHAGSTCGVYILRGEATEISFKPSGVGLLVPEGSKQVYAGEITMSADSDAHLVGNFASPAQELVTLHCYSPPLAAMQVFDESETFFADYPTISACAATSGCYHRDV
jgi:cysteine dioxygenase